MSNLFSSAIFCYRNSNKVVNGDYGRLPVAVGQVNNVVNSVMTYDSAIGRGTKTAVDVVKYVSKGEKVLQYVGKGISFVSRNVNPIICVASGAKVLTSEDKPAALVQQSAALSSMFFVENMMKKHMDKLVKIKGVDKIAERVVNYSKSIKGGGVIPHAIKGVAFAVGSVCAYSVGEKFGNMLTGKKNHNDVQK